uniref:Putative secreted protein n=1 Tax=Anopheles darlingi TaxID=43151 RepID=A0A2M4D9N0_ANODA
MLVKFLVITLLEKLVQTLFRRARRAIDETLAWLDHRQARRFEELGAAPWRAVFFEAFLLPEEVLREYFGAVIEEPAPAANHVAAEVQPVAAEVQLAAAELLWRTQADPTAAESLWWTQAVSATAEPTFPTEPF